MKRMAAISSAAVSCAILTGCVSLGGNVKGNFVCRAPDGMCAPTSKIDDQALAVMDGDGAAQAGAPDAPQNVSPASAMAHSPHALKVVLPARADRFGRWRGQSVVYVEPDAIAGQGAPAPVRQSAAAPARLSYAELAAGAPGLAAFDQALTVNGASAATVSPSASIRQQVEQTLGKSTAGAGTTPPPASTPAAAGASVRSVSAEPAPGIAATVRAPSFPATSEGEH